MSVIDGSVIAVVGGAGFLGSHIVSALAKTNAAREIRVLDNFVRGSKSNLAEVMGEPRVHVTEGSITDANVLAQVIEGSDYVFHLAALWLHECINDPRAAVDVNIGGTFNVIDVSSRAGVKKVVYSSSASVYGNAVESPMTEEHPLNNRTMYGATKIAGEQMFRAYHAQRGLDYVGLRYMNLYGPRMDYRGAYVSVIMKVIDRIRAGLPPIIYGDGKQSYDFVHVSDVARANLLALEATSTDDFFNIGTGVETTIDEVVHLLLDLTGADLEPEYRPDEMSLVTRRVGSTAKTRKILGFEAAVSLASGLQSVLDWRETN